MIFFYYVLCVIPDSEDETKVANNVQILFYFKLHAQTSRIPKIIDKPGIERLLDNVKLLKIKIKQIRDRNFQLKKQKKMFKKVKLLKNAAIASKLLLILAKKNKITNVIAEELNSLEAFLSCFCKMVPLQLTDLEWFQVKGQKKLKIIKHCIALEKIFLKLMIKTNILLEKTKSDKSKIHLQKMYAILALKKTKLDEFYLFFCDNNNF